MAPLWLSTPLQDMHTQACARPFGRSHGRSQESCVWCGAMTVLTVVWCGAMTVLLWLSQPVRAACSA